MEYLIHKVYTTRRRNIRQLKHWVDVGNILAVSEN